MKNTSTQKGSVKSKEVKDSSKAISPKIESKLNWLPKKTFELEITIPKKEVEKTYQKILAKLAQDTEIKGFRKGKAPLDLVEKQIGKEKIFDQVVQEIVSQAYYSEVNHHNLRPIIAPKIIPVSLSQDNDWIIKAQSCEAPMVKLGKYQEAIKGLKAKSAIWTPEKATEEKEDKVKELSQEEILEELIKNVEIEISDLLIEEETNRLLADMVDQVKAVGLTVDQYFQSKNLTQEKVKTQYQEFATKSLIIEFSLNQIAIDNNISVEQEEINKIINQTPDPKIKESLQNPNQQTYIKVLLTKQKTVDFLKSL